MLLNHEDHGSGQPIVLLHGFPFDHTIWAPQVETLEAKYRVIAVDLRGHGKSEPTEGVYTMDAMADDVVALLDSLHLQERATLAGHSMGGYVALSAVLRFPSRFQRLMLINTRAKADAPEVAERRLNSAREIESTGETAAFIEAMIPRLFARSTIVESPDVVERTRTIMARTNPRAIVSALRGMAERPDRSNDLASIAIPTLVITGTEDVISPPDEAREIAALLPYAEAEIIANSGHMAAIENPSDLNQVILRFLGPSA